MLTPQEIQEKTFAKAVFGGYDMRSVDEFVEPLAQDYITLYKENDVLKSKLKVLVRKMEEYREEEEKRRQTRKSCEEMKQEAEEACRVMLKDAELQAAQRNTEEILAQEEHRVNCAKQLAASFIELLDKDIRGHLALLDSLRERDLSVETEAVKKAVAAELKAAAAVTAVRHDDTRRIADEIEESLGKMGVSEESEKKPAPAPRHTESPTIKFDDLQFGKNYNPVGK